MKALPVLQPLCCGPGAPPIEPSAAGALAEPFTALADPAPPRRAPSAAGVLAWLSKALAAPTRVAIVNRLAAGEECCVCDLTDAFELSQPTVSHHLRILRAAGLVAAAPRG